MKGKENVCQQRRPGINLRGFSSRISSTTDISSLFEYLPGFILRRADERLRSGRRNLLLAVAKRASRQHNRPRRRASPSRISFLVWLFAPSACRRNQGARIRFVEKSSILEYRSWRSFETVTYSSKYSRSFIASSRCRHLGGNTESKGKSVLPIVCRNVRYRGARHFQRPVFLIRNSTLY